VSGPKCGWNGVLAPSIADLDQDMAQAAFATLPEEFQRLCEGVVIRVEDFPDDETLDAMNCEANSTFWGCFAAAAEPNPRRAR